MTNNKSIKKHFLRKAFQKIRIFPAMFWSVLLNPRLGRGSRESVCNERRSNDLQLSPRKMAGAKMSQTNWQKKTTCCKEVSTCAPSSSSCRSITSVMSKTMLFGGGGFLQIFKRPTETSSTHNSSFQNASNVCCKLVFFSWKKCWIP